MPEIWSTSAWFETSISAASYLGIDHESKHIFDAVECQDLAVRRLPHALPICVAILYYRTNFIDVLGISDNNFEIWALLIPLKSV